MGEKVSRDPLGKILKELVEGKSVSIEVETDAIDQDALRLLAYLYKRIMDDGASYADAERILVNALWWNITFSEVAQTVMKEQDDEPQ